MLWGIRTIPQPVQLASMPLWAGIFYTLVPKARRTVEANLRRVLGEAPAAVVHARSYRLFVNYAQSIANMYALYLFGPFVERALGTTRFVIAYLTMAVASSVFVYWLTEPQIATIGASGAVFGLFGLALVLLIRLRAELLRRERGASWVREVLS